MTAKERIATFQTSLGVTGDGLIGNNTLKAFATKFGKTKAETIQFFANIHHESGGFTIERENMNYRANRIMEIFGVGKHSAKVTMAEAEKLSGKPYELAERVYGIGNPTKAKELGNNKAGDGWKYRGGGALQITGGTAYLKYGGETLYNNPDAVGTSSYYFTTAIAEFDQRGIWKLCTDLSYETSRKVCKRINGGYNGWDDRWSKIQYYNKLWK